MCHITCAMYKVSGCTIVVPYKFKAAAVFAILPFHQSDASMEKLLQSYLFNGNRLAPVLANSSSPSTNNPSPCPDQSLPSDLADCTTHFLSLIRGQACGGPCGSSRDAPDAQSPAAATSSQSKSVWTPQGVPSAAGSPPVPSATNEAAPAHSQQASRDLGLSDQASFPALGSRQGSHGTQVGSSLPGPDRHSKPH